MGDEGDLDGEEELVRIRLVLWGLGESNLSSRMFRFGKKMRKVYLVGVGSKRVCREKLERCLGFFYFREGFLFLF